MVKIKYRYLIILAFIITINSSTLKKDDELYLIHVEYQYNITKYNFTILNRDDAEINEYLSARIAFMNHTNSDKDIFGKYSDYINQQWLFLVNSSEAANELLGKDDYKDKKLIINGIIVPKIINYTMPDENENKNIPVFEVDVYFIDTFYANDIRNMEKNIYYIFEIKRAIGNYPETYLLIIALLCFLISITMFIYTIKPPIHFPLAIFSRF